MTGLKHLIAEKMRRWADRIDHPCAPKAIGWSFTFEHERAHTESDTQPPRIDWEGLCRG